VEGDNQRQAVTALSTLCNAWYATLSILKFLGLGLRLFVSNEWNIVDALVVFFPLVSQVLGFSTSARVWSILRISKLIYVNPTTRLLVKLLLRTMNRLLNVLILLLMAFVMFGVLGVDQFGNTKFGMAIYEESGNFRHFGRAFFALAQVLMGSRWDLMMDDLRIKPPNCQADTPEMVGDCGDPNFAPVYFMGFHFLVTFVLLSVVQAMGIVDYMMTFENVGAKPISRAHMKHFVHVWSMLDPHANGYIPIRGLRMLLTLLDEPLGMNRNRINKIRYLTYMYHARSKAEEREAGASSLWYKLVSSRFNAVPPHQLLFEEAAEMLLVHQYPYETLDSPEMKEMSVRSHRSPHTSQARSVARIRSLCLHHDRGMGVLAHMPARRLIPRPGPDMAERHARAEHERLLRRCLSRGRARQRLSA
jgi:hypothetical protein